MNQTDNPAPQKTILLVNDAQEVSKLMALFLQRTTDYHIIFAKDGLEGLEMVARHNPDVIVSDIRMPGIDGFTMVERIRETSDVPVLLHAAGGEGFALRAIEAGADNYLTTPFNLHELKTEIEALINR